MNSQDLEKKYHQFIVSLNKFLYKKQIKNALDIIKTNCQDLNLTNCQQYFLKNPSFYIGASLCDKQENVELINKLNPTIIDLFKGSIYYQNIEAFSILVNYYKPVLLEDKRLYEEMDNYLNYKLQGEAYKLFKEVLIKEEVYIESNIDLNFWVSLLNHNYDFADDLIKNANLDYNYRNLAKYDNHLFHQIAYEWEETKENLSHFEKICTYFINKNFDANILDNWGNTPLNSMIRKAKYGFAKTFLQTLYPKEDINLKNQSGKTILHSIFYDKSLPYHLKKVIVNESTHHSFVRALDFIMEMINLGADLNLPSGLHNRGKSINAILKEDEKILIYFEKNRLERIIHNTSTQTLSTSQVKKGKI